MGCVVDVIRGVLSSIKGGHPERIGGIPILTSNLPVDCVQSTDLRYASGKHEKIRFPLNMQDSLAKG